MPAKKAVRSMKRKTGRKATLKRKPVGAKKAKGKGTIRTGPKKR